MLFINLFHHMKNQLVISIVIGVVLIGAAFYGGMQYAKAGLKTNVFAPGQRPGMAQGNGNRANGFGGMLIGEILSKDDKSITVKIPDGGSKIVFFSKETKVNKASDGTADDLVVGKQVRVNGAQNTDGSVNASNINLETLVVPAPQTK